MPPVGVIPTHSWRLGAGAPSLLPPLASAPARRSGQQTTPRRLSMLPAPLPVQITMRLRPLPNAMLPARLPVQITMLPMGVGPTRSWHPGVGAPVLLPPLPGAAA